MTPRTLTYTLPDIATATDAALEQAFPRWDGAWSSQTRALVTRFSAAGLDLNDNWASAPTSWNCPCCQRAKPDLVRLTSTGVLLCHLEWHHDHLRDRAKAILRGSNPAPEERERVALNRAIELCRSLVERFFVTLVCQDCNAAEGLAKTALRGVIDPDFSFSPAEIAAFITVRPNQPHGVDVDKARAIWADRAGEVEDLIAFARVLADRLAAGRHRKAGSPPRYIEGPTADAILLRATAIDPESPSPYALVTALSARSVRRDGMSRAPAKARRVIAPTDDDFADFDIRQPNYLLWRRAPADWRCAACNRDRRQILRRSNSGAWTGSLHGFNAYRSEHDFIALSYREPEDEEGLVIGDHDTIVICGDCRHIITDVKTREPALTEDCWSLADLKALVGTPQPHARHTVDLEAAIALARASASAHRQAAVSAYYKHCSKAHEIRHLVDWVQRQEGCTVDEALRSLAWHEAYSGDANQAWEDRLRWLRSESDRFAARDAELRGRGLAAPS
jgi:hypothetical protein